ncbi:M56 family metallopeptidase, partial [Candidatus Latescibacterota bacterium]
VSWQVTILIAIIWLVDRLSFRASPLFKYWLWCIVLVRLCIPVSIELPTGIDLSFFSLVEKNVTGPISRHMPVQKTGEKHMYPGMLPVSEEFDRNSYTSEYRDESHVRITVSKIFFVWYSLFIVIGLYIGARSFAIIRRLKYCRTVDKPELTAMFNNLCRAMGIKRPVKLLYMDSDIGDVPSVIGFFSYGILLPRTIMDEWQAEEIKPILLHELAHIKRRDLMINLIQLVVQAVYFFHPLVWFANRKLLMYREEICDDIAVLALGNMRKRYTLSMLRVIENAVREPALGFVGIGFTERKSTVKKRIERVLSVNYRTTTRLSFVSVLLLILFGTSGFAFSSRKSIDVDSASNRKIEQSEMKSANKKELIVEINSKREVFIDGTKVSFDMFETYLAQEKHKTGNNTVLIRADIDAKHGDILKLMNMARTSTIVPITEDMKFPVTHKIITAADTMMSKPNSSELVIMGEKIKNDITILIKGNDIFYVNTTLASSSNLARVLQQEMKNKNTKRIIIKSDDAGTVKDMDFVMKTAYNLNAESIAVDIRNGKPF